MTRADTFGRAALEQRQLMYTATSLDFHTLPPQSIDFDAVWKRDYQRYNNATYVPGDHFWASFTHLNGYSSNYYTYVFDKVIALDFFAAIRPWADLLGGPCRAALPAKRAGASGRPARPDSWYIDFLGRDTNLDAYRRWMLEEFAAPAAAAH